MASSSDSVATTTNWKENMTLGLKEKLYQGILGIFHDQVPHFARNPEVNGRLLSTIRFWAEKFLNEVSDQKDYIEKVSRQICLLFAKVEVSLVPMALAEAAKAKEQEAQMVSTGKRPDSMGSLGRVEVSLVPMALAEAANAKEQHAQMASNGKILHSMGSLERMMHELKLGSKFQTSEQQAGTSQRPASNAPHQCSTSQQLPMVMQHTGECSTSEDVNLVPMTIKYVHEILEDDARYGTNNERWRLYYAKQELQYLKYQLPSLVFIFVDKTLKYLLLQDMLQDQMDEDAHYQIEEDVHFAGRVRECIKQIVTPKQFLPEGFDESSLEYVKLEVLYLIEKHKRLSVQSFETHRRLSLQR